MKCLCLGENPTEAGTVVDHVRLFRNHPQLRWDFRVHEQIIPAIRRLGGDVRWCDVVIHHVGYQDPNLRRRKRDRDLRLLQKANQDRPDHPFTLFNLGSVIHEMGKVAEAVPHLRRSLGLSDPADSIVRKLYALLSQCHRELGQADLAAAACRTGLEYYPDDTELLYLDAQYRRAAGDRLAPRHVCCGFSNRRNRGISPASTPASRAKARHSQASYPMVGLAEAEGLAILRRNMRPSCRAGWDLGRSS